MMQNSSKNLSVPSVILGFSLATASLILYQASEWHREQKLWNIYRALADYSEKEQAKKV